ncbi:transcription factor HES-2-like [Brienomyrus brachyistius]|uniref:transcription factor HES-2-like n=1 Tax=Brienomyrus brachyistius TaxID=42636 RepID=UPI0020B3D537|nr:transcription factor HES-2-like [Brienomyrus brachyistius]
MTPSIAFAASQPYYPRLTVAERKEANETRKTLKPLMEKRRRARINESLNQLKNLIVPLIGKDNSRYSKLEKADILDMTVRFLRDLPSAPVKNRSDSYKEGYEACLQRVSTMLPKTNLLDKDTYTRVNGYLRQSLSAAVAPPCQNCRDNNAGLLPQMDRRNPTCTPITTPRPSSTNSHIRAVSQNLSANMWRPW